MEQEPKTPRERVEDFIIQLVPDWRPTRQHFLWTVRVVVALVALYVLIRIGYTLQWTGFGQTEVKQGIQLSKTLWDWMDLLIIPIVLAIGGFLFTRSENRATQAAAERRAQEDALQAYLDNMAEMLIPNNDQPTLSDKDPPAKLKTVARARTLTVLPRLAADGKGRVVQFLRESNLIPREARKELSEDQRETLLSPEVWDQQGEVGREKVVDLSGADLSDAVLLGLNLHEVAFDNVYLGRADLRFADLENADLRYAYLRDANLDNSLWYGADLTSAHLSNASLRSAQLTSATETEPHLKAPTLRGADLSNADLSDANLSNADLRHANLSNANLSNANLSNADLFYADLPGSKLWGTDLSGANLSVVTLTGAKGWTEEQLAQAQSLDGAIMPDETPLKSDWAPDQPTFNDWRQSREGA